MNFLHQWKNLWITYQLRMIQLDSIHYDVGRTLFISSILFWSLADHCSRATPEPIDCYRCRIIPDFLNNLFPILQFAALILAWSRSNRKFLMSSSIFCDHVDLSSLRLSLHVFELLSLFDLNSISFISIIDKSRRWLVFHKNLEAFSSENSKRSPIHRYIRYPILKPPPWFRSWL